MFRDVFVVIIVCLVVNAIFYIFSRSIFRFLDRVGVFLTRAFWCLPQTDIEQEKVDYVVDDVAFQEWWQPRSADMSPLDVTRLERYAYAGWAAHTRHVAKKRKGE